MSKETLSWILNISYTIVFATVGFLINMLVDDLVTIEDRLREMQATMPVRYVLKADYREDQKVLLNALIEIGHKIDHNAEYMEADYNRRMDKIESLIEKIHFRNTK